MARRNGPWSGCGGEVLTEARRGNAPTRPRQSAGVRAGVRDPGARALAGLEPVRLDLGDPRTFPAAVAGCEGLFLVRPPAISDVGPTLNALVDAAVAAGVRHVVFLSVVGADRSRWI